MRSSARPSPSPTSARSSTSARTGDEHASEVDERGPGSISSRLPEGAAARLADPRPGSAGGRHRGPPRCSGLEGDCPGSAHSDPLAQSVGVSVVRRRRRRRGRRAEGAQPVPRHPHVALPALPPESLTPRPRTLGRATRARRRRPAQPNCDLLPVQVRAREWGCSATRRRRPRPRQVRLLLRGTARTRDDSPPPTACERTPSSTASGVRSAPPRDGGVCGQSADKGLRPGSSRLGSRPLMR